jgi:hypothetical protein
MTRFTALKQVLTHFKAILARWPLRIILRMWNALIRVWVSGFGYRKRCPHDQTTLEPKDRPTLCKGPCSGIDILASRTPFNWIRFPREQQSGNHDTELLPPPVTSSRPSLGTSGIIRSPSDSLAIPTIGIFSHASHTSLDLTSSHYPSWQSSVDGRSRSTPNLTHTIRESRARLEGDPVPDSHTLGMPPSPSNSRPQSRNGRPDSVPVIVVPPQEEDIGDYAASGTTLYPNCEASHHSSGDNQYASAGYDVADADPSDPHPSQHWNSPAMVSCVQHNIVTE